MPQSVEVGILRAMGAIDDVGNAHRFQVEPHHLGPAVKPGGAPDRFAHRLTVQIPGEDCGGLWWQWLHLGLLRLVEPGRQCNEWRLAPQVEVRGGEVGQCSGSETGGSSGEVKAGSVITSQPPESAGTGLGAFEQLAEFIRSELPACMACIYFGVEQCQAFERIASHAVGSCQPA
ncbi:MAG: hypothetical protein U0796_10210 [Gemmatales bacterium]